jgi:two-component system, OmpR family, response regulator
LVRTPHILIVDDDGEIRDLVGRLLEREDFRVSRAEDGVGARRILLDNAIDLIVLDVMLPGKDGLTLCRELRGEQIQVPIIMLTAKGDDIDRILGLEMGADDYLSKPFNGRELTARIRAVLRRTPVSPPDDQDLPARYLCFEGWRLDTGKRDLLSKDNVVVSLSSGEFELLFALARRPQRTLSRDQLLDLTRGRSTVLFDRSIDIQVSRLRRKLEEDPKNPKLIKTVWGGGYLFAADVAVE